MKEMKKRTGLKQGGRKLCKSFRKILIAQREKY